MMQRRLARADRLEAAADDLEREARNWGHVHGTSSTGRMVDRAARFRARAHRLRGAVR